MDIIIGSARHDETGKYINGQKGDSLQSSVPDLKGEVSMQKFYVHRKGWNIIRAKDIKTADKIAEIMRNACNNPNIGYSQSDRYGIIRNGTGTKQKCNCDCSSLVRQCIREATGKDPGDFTTRNAVIKFDAMGCFEKVIPYTSKTLLYSGDILCTKSKGHIVIVTDGNKRIGEEISAECYPVYDGYSISIVVALQLLGIDSSVTHRKKIAKANGIEGYKGTAAQNEKMLKLLKEGKLIKA